MNIELNSGIYKGDVKHRRYSPRKHNFDYEIAMLVLDLDELNVIEQMSWLFSTTGFAPLMFNQKDYLSAQVKTSDSAIIADNLKARVLDKVDDLGGDIECDRVLFVGQVRHFGIYFSPINCFFCYQGSEVRYMLAEVSNTPWNQRHYYLVDLNNPQPSDKAFHVSPFMDLNMKYIWRIEPPSSSVKVGIENRSTQKLFDVNLCLFRREMSHHSLRTMLLQFPFMTLKIVQGIYWQALKLFIKRVPFIGHPDKSAER
ncbi:DUF1365 domain-containing protein [Shewanella gelidimarina]|uniref:DUF1365 domain-containing protein n=1 Tax=Shewanella gelidimarina TaxID=56813 RepID=UPI00200CF740|nr:DUF1365 domain-containing protein [Shewanella gelidimarina]MCL1058614.1 DUF1365 domain-containing protein [Shewanella gelidimarina]